MIFNIGTDGTAQAIAPDNLSIFDGMSGVSVKRASHVEPTDNGKWTADLSPVGGPLLGPFDTRSEALAKEQEWLTPRLGGLSHV